MSVYVAASSADIDRARAVIALLRADGIEVTSTWPDVIAAENLDNPNPFDASLADRFRWSSTALLEVSASDVLWLLAPAGAPSFGAGVEFGYARRGGAVVVASGRTTRSIFGAQAHEFATDEDAFAFLQHLARRR